LFLLHPNSERDFSGIRFRRITFSTVEDSRTFSHRDFPLRSFPGPEYPVSKNFHQLSPSHVRLLSEGVRGGGTGVPVSLLREKFTSCSSILLKGKARKILQKNLRIGGLIHNCEFAKVSSSFRPWEFSPPGRTFTAVRL